jgi:hypothetical protein
VAGIVLGIGTWFRNEGYVFAAAVLAVDLPRFSRQGNTDRFRIR